MRLGKTISGLVLCIAVLSLAASAYGVFSNQGPGKYDFTSLHGEAVTIHGKGLYRYDSVSLAAQAIAQDIVTMSLGIPLLVISLRLSTKGSLRGRLLLTGTLGYFLYTYASYAFLVMYNQLFLIYVILLSASFFAFAMAMMSFDLKDLSSHFSPRLPAKFVGGFLIFLAAAIGLMWLERIVPPLIKGTAPVGLEHYTTLVIQGLDLGFFLPAAALSGVLLIRRNPFGYLLASVAIIKVITLLAAISAMAIGMVLSGVKVNVVEMALFPLLNLVALYCLALIPKHTN